MALHHTIVTIRAMLRAGRRVYVADWKYRNRVYTPRWFIVRGVRWREPKPGQGAGWIECRVGVKQRRWLMVLGDGDIEVRS